jgi:hypothetical protein
MRQEFREHKRQDARPASTRGIEGWSVEEMQKARCDHKRQYSDESQLPQLHTGIEKEESGGNLLAWQPYSLSAAAKPKPWSRPNDDEIASG